MTNNQATQQNGFIKPFPAYHAKRVPAVFAKQNTHISPEPAQCHQFTTIGACSSAFTHSMAATSRLTVSLIPLMRLFKAFAS
ncbi:hypothetical protein [Bifidobacterium leontopitheci]|uniref:hypothetical protein n=1 Tax=Bifidobacterium leontopitheci TaxID=2650774 RepID=UPI001264AE99|nr:hypothetical protein [Bifidobacterium leontopitheci]